MRRSQERSTYQSLYYPRVMMRTLAQVLTEEYSEYGVHVANVVIDGLIFDVHAPTSHADLAVRCVPPFCTRVSVPRIVVALTQDTLHTGAQVSECVHLKAEEGFFDAQMILSAQAKGKKSCSISLNANSPKRKGDEHG